MLLDMILVRDTFNIPSPIYTAYFPLIQLTTQSSRKLKLETRCQYHDLN